MKIGQRTLREHLALTAPLLAVIAAVWLLRLVSGMSHGPSWLVRLLSVTGAIPLTVFLAAFLIHVKNFGGYASVILAAFILTAWGQLLIVIGIAAAVVTGTQNVFTRPEFSLPTEDPQQLLHMGSHLIAIPLGSLFGAAMGCFMLWLLRKLVPQQPPDKRMS